VNRPIRVGHIDLSFHDASAREVERLLDSHGHRIERSAAPHEEMFRQLRAGKVDMLVSAWLPASHGAYLAPMADEVREVTVLYEPYCIWGVPDYIPESMVSGIADLLRAPTLERMERLIQGIGPGAGISRFSTVMIDAYGLGQAGYHFRPGTEAECFGRFEAAVQENRWIVVPLWHPQFLHNRYRIRALADPLGLLGGVDKAVLVIRRDAEARFGEATLAALAQLHLGNARMSALDDRIVKENAA